MSAHDVITDSLRYARAGERVAGMLDPLKMLAQQVDGITELAPELAPELAAVNGELAELLDHVRAMMRVLEAKVDLL